MTSWENPCLLSNECTLVGHDISSRDSFFFCAHTQVLFVMVLSGLCQYIYIHTISFFFDDVLYSKLYYGTMLILTTPHMI